MANQRIFLWVALALILWLNYQAWMRDYHPPAPPAAESPTATSPTTGGPPPPGSLDQSVPKPQESAASGATGGTSSQPEVPVPAGAPEVGAAPRIHVVTDVLDLRSASTAGIWCRRTCCAIRARRTSRT